MHPPASKATPEGEPAQKSPLRCQLPNDSLALAKLSPLALKAQAGDPDAVGLLVGELAPGVLRALSAMLGRDHPELEDLAQEVLLDVVDSLPDFRGECTLLHFAVRIAARKSVNVQRRRVTVKGWLEGLWRKEHPLNTGPKEAHETTLSAKRRELLQQLLKDLPDAQAEALLLRVVFGHSIEEISRIANVPANTVRSRLRLAKVALKKRIELDPTWLELTEGLL